MKVLLCAILILSACRAFAQTDGLRTSGLGGDPLPDRLHLHGTPSPTPAPAPTPATILAGGTYYYDVYIAYFLGENVTIKHRGGEATIPFKSLPPEWQREYAQERAKELADQAQPKPPRNLPAEVVVTRTLQLKGGYDSPVGRTPSTAWSMLIPMGTKLKVLSVAGLYLETNYSGDMLVPLECTDYFSRRIPAQPAASASEQARLIKLRCAKPAF